MGGDDVPAQQRRDGHGGGHRQAGIVRKLLQCGLNVRKRQGRIGHGIQFIHGKHQAGHAQQLHQQAVAARLRQQLQGRIGPVQLGGIDQHNRRIGLRGRSDHVARVLLMPGGIANDEFAPVGGKVAPGHVDGDALLALGGEAVGQQGQVGLALALHARQVVLQHGLAVYQQAANQCALAIVHAAAGDELEGGNMVICASNACWISAGSY